MGLWGRPITEALPNAPSDSKAPEGPEKLYPGLNAPGGS